MLSHAEDTPLCLDDILPSLAEGSGLPLCHYDDQREEESFSFHLYFFRSLVASLCRDDNLPSLAEGSGEGLFLPCGGDEGWSSSAI